MAWVRNLGALVGGGRCIGVFYYFWLRPLLEWERVLDVLHMDWTVAHRQTSDSQIYARTETLSESNKKKHTIVIKYM